MYKSQDNNVPDECQDIVASDERYLSSTELALEWWAAGLRITKLSRHELWLAGIPIDTCLMMVGVERVAIDGRRYRPCSTGGWAYITPIQVPVPLRGRRNRTARRPFNSSPRVLWGGWPKSLGAEIIDLICWDIATPDSWALRNNLADWCGCVVADEPTAIRRNPLSWLRHDCDGLVLLTDDRIRRWQLLRDCNKIVAEDEIHADELSAALTDPYPKPLIYL